VKLFLRAIVVLLMVGIFSCAPSRRVTTERSLSVNQVFSRVKDRNEKIRTLKGEGTITIESSETSRRGSFTVGLRKPDSLLMEFRGPFGIHAATLMLSREKFLFYNWMENTADVGKPDGKTLNSILQLKMQFDQILNAFAGEIAEINSQDTLVKFSVENNLYVVRYRSAEWKKEYWIDGDTFIVIDCRVMNQQGETVLAAHTSETEELESIYMPKFLRVVFPKERQSITIAYDDLSINKPVSCLFLVPKQAEIIYR
jgi:outer membrane lipoprotein-sorting protein